MFKGVLSNLVEKIYNFADFFHTSRIKNFYNKLDFDLVIDVGSHKGEFINSVVDNSTPVYSFEPQSSLMGVLKKNTCKKNVIKYYDFALSNFDGSIDLFINNLTSTSSIKESDSSSYWIKFKSFLLGGQLYAGKESVSVKKLDDILFHEIRSKKNVLLKIDVEGSEAEVLQGATKILNKCDIKFIQLESANYSIYSGNPNNLAFEILESLGYKIEKEFLFPLLNFKDVIFARKTQHR